MEYLFLTTAAVGGTVLVCQFLLSLLGMADGDAELADDMPSASDADFSGDMSHPGDVAHTGQSIPHDHHAGDHPSSSWLFGVLSFRTLVAASTFFGLSGMIAHSAGMTVPAQLTMACLGGLAALYGVHALMRSISRLSEDGTLHIRRAIGRPGTVYLTIPANRSGAGKVQLNVQHRLVEYLAVTSAGHPLPSGSKVVVTRTVDAETLEVEPVTAEVAEDLAHSA